MNEPAVTLTDFGLTLLCLVLCWKLWAFPVENKSLQKNFIGVFIGAGLAALWGGIVHGFLPPEDSTWTKIFWTATLLTVGVSAYNLWQINLQLLFTDRMAKMSQNLVRGLFVVYVLVVLFVTQEFYVAILSYIPPALVLFLLLLMRSVRAPTRFNLAGLFGLMFTFIAAYIQQAQISIDPEYFNYNALYHVLQALGLWGLYWFGSRAARWNS